MENQASATKTMLTYGIYWGVASIIVSLLNYSFGNIYKPHWILNVLNFALMIGFIVWGIKAFKADNGGFLKMGQAIKVGLGIALIASVIGIIYLFLFANVIEPEFQTNMVTAIEQNIMEQNPDMPEEQLEMALNMGTKFATPGMMAVMSLAGALFFGLIISLIAGAVMKNENTELQ
jgi:hypothetical protein